MEKKQLKATVMEHREPLADMYLGHYEELFSVFQEPSSTSQELVLPLLLEQVDSMQRLA
ncbi:hypothetical protein [Sporosarcina psychrophila]|uniref:hypothetical protein n=1 Tax=Sporosarcina psychrophila TaxID=1476 RepID=UPI000A55C4CC|nr:hypothetical protein [Sporosarcina psychrophila]